MHPEQYVVTHIRVLTLLLLEFGFGVLRRNLVGNFRGKSLNPSFTGIWLRGTTDEVEKALMAKS